MGQTNVTKGLDTWAFQDNYVERLLDNAAYTSAHPDDTLILAGPARFNSTQVLADAGGSPVNFAESLLAIGMMQGFSVSQSKPTQPVMAIGSGRQFFLSGKAQTSWNMQRLFVNGRNLLRALYTNARSAGIDVSKFDDPAAAADPAEKFWINLDSELFLIPFGLGVFFRDKVHNNIGAFYMELCVIQSWQISFNAGGNIIAEAVSGLADRIVPIYPTEFSGNKNPSYPATSTLDQSVTNLDPTTIYGDMNK
jgi:hypothetical protein